jgi:type IV pilus assembly protein PilY1
MRYWINDLRSDFTNNVQDVNAPWQHVTLYGLSIGARGSVDAAGLAAITAGTRDWPAPTGVGATDSIDDLWHAALNSRGKYFNAANPQELAESIVSALTDFVGPNGTGTGIALAGARITNTRNFGYLTSYDSQWTGDLRKYALDTRTGALPADADGNPLNRPVWSAQQQLDLQALGTGWDTARKIVTTDDSKNAVPFRLANLSASQQTSLNAGWAAVTRHAALFAGCPQFPARRRVERGPGQHEFSQAKRTRYGDIVYSGAVVVGAPGLPLLRHPAWLHGVRGSEERKNAHGVQTGRTTACSMHSSIPRALTDAGKEAWAYVPNVLFHNDDPTVKAPSQQPIFSSGP